MRLGFNFTLGETTPLVRRLLAEGRIDYVELLIDNFLTLDADTLAGAFDAPMGFHIMFSRFIEADAASLDDMAQRLRTLIDRVKPLYVSDHVARFSHEGRQLYHLAEIDYQADYARVRDAVDAWQQRLGCQLLLENYPSILEGGHDAPAFFERLCRETGAGVLFDISNAVCAHLNCGVPLEAWLPVIDASRHFHVAGYNLSILQPHLVLDTHDRPLSDETLAFIETWRERFDSPGATLTYERDDAFVQREIDNDLATLRTLFAQPEVRRHG
ncbi:methanobactin biosynthesis cassette protein MbnB [Metapseudomonas otitidis]|uniref:methanobactin biosynthesis protein MbnB n=1 Tax=Metapseudomonas otitidis TaxID=319939 RepID=UPI00254091D2|nr:MULTISPECIES: methanobactin biosynthesis protein MbnB [Pseudomonas]MDL5594222.1 methanobactin biosynthesis cassette protein MbnB [Bacillus subtilis]WIF64992.1 methanobactin biosynthesis cassette protein MbnB [Pseudomonas otitidis]